MCVSAADILDNVSVAINLLASQEFGRLQIFW